MVWKLKPGAAAVPGVPATWEAEAKIPLSLWAYLAWTTQQQSVPPPKQNKVTQQILKQYFWDVKGIWIWFDAKEPFILLGPDLLCFPLLW